MNGFSFFDRAWPHIIRAVGLGIAIWQLIFDSVDRPYLLLLAGGMMGLKSVKDISDVLSKRKSE